MEGVCNQECWTGSIGHFIILNRVIRVGFIEKVRLEQRLEEAKERADIYRGVFQGERTRWE